MAQTAFPHRRRVGLGLLSRQVLNGDFADGRVDVSVDDALVAYLCSDGAVGRYAGFHPTGYELPNRLLGFLNAPLFIDSGDDFAQLFISVLIGAFEHLTGTLSVAGLINGELLQNTFAFGGFGEVSGVAIQLQYKLMSAGKHSFLQADIGNPGFQRPRCEVMTSKDKLYVPESEAECLDIYRKLTLIRQVQEAIVREYYNDEMKTPVHLGIGLEGISTGVAHCLPPNTRSYGQLRNHGQYLSLTAETDNFFGELYGKVTGTGGGKAGSMHLSAPEHGLMATSGIVASTISMAVGAGMAAKYLKTGHLAVAMFGDGAAEEGEFWESMNFACLHGLRVLFVCEENDIAVNTFGSDRRGYKSLTEAMKGFDCHVLEGDGTDVRNVIEIVSNAIELMTTDAKPAFTYFNWFRYLEHVGPRSDFDVGYRPQPTAGELQERDPVGKFESYLLSIGLDANGLQAVRDEIAFQIETSIQKARSARYPGEGELFQGVFA